MLENHLDKNKSYFYLALLSALTAIGVHIYLTLHYYELNLGISSGSAICNISSVFNCDAVAASGYSQFLGIPIALWGATTNAVLFILLSMAFLRLSESLHHLLKMTFLLSTFIALTSLIMGAISMTKLSLFCLFCIVEYLLSFVTWGALFKLHPTNPFENLSKDIKYFFTVQRGLIIFIVSIVPITFLFNSMWIDSLGGDKLQQYINDDFARWQVDKEFIFNDEGLKEGPDKSFMTIVEFADFRCPHCKHAAPSLRAFAASHHDVKFIFKAFPLDGGCSANSQIPARDGVSCLLAKVVYCSEKVSQKGWIAYDKIFENQENFSSPDYKEQISSVLAKNQISEVDIMGCVQSEESHKALIQQSQEGVNANVEGTPTIYVNGKKVKLGHSITMLEKLYTFLKNQSEVK